MNHQQMNRIDEQLNSEAQRTVASVVKRLPEDAPSLAWRSALNERILADQSKMQRKRRFWVFARPAMAAIAAASLAIAFVAKAPNSSVVLRPSGSMEQALIEAHLDASQGMDVAGIGLTPDEVERFAANTVPVGEELWGVDAGYF